jgi:cardiolipin synthase
VIDDELSIVGTANLDNRSLRLNFEVVAAIYDSGITAELAQNIKEHLE